MKPYEVSIVIPWANRNEISYALERNISAFNQYKSEIIIVCCGGRIRDLRNLVDNFKLRVRVIRVNRRGFNKSLALNLGAAKSRGDILLFLDCDVIVERGILARLISRAKSDGACAIRYVHESANKLEHPAGTLVEIINKKTFKFADGTKTSLVTTRINLLHQARNAPGLLAVRRILFQEVQGMNSLLKGWGWEDNDFMLRIQVCTGRIIKFLGQATHLSHGDEKRDIRSTSKSINETGNYLVSLGLYASGIFTGTLASDREKWGSKARWVKLG